MKYFITFSSIVIMVNCNNPADTDNKNTIFNNTTWESIHTEQVTETPKPSYKISFSEVDSIFFNATFYTDELICLPVDSTHERCTVPERYDSLSGEFNTNDNKLIIDWTMKRYNWFGDLSVSSSNDTIIYSLNQGEDTLTLFWANGFLGFTTMKFARTAE